MKRLFTLAAVLLAVTASAASASVRPAPIPLPGGPVVIVLPVGCTPPLVRCPIVPPGNPYA